MTMFYALHDVEIKEKGEVMVVEGHGKALKVVNLDEPRAQVYLRHVGDEQEQRWYLDFGASNHMTGSKEAFSELDGNVTGTVKFSDGSRVVIRGCGTIIFRCQKGEHRALTDVYYIPQLRSSIISIGQLDERGSEVLIKDDVLRIRDQEQRLHAKLLTSKTDAAEAVKKFKARAKMESGKKLRVQRTDRGGEFTSVEFAAYCVDQGVV
ncbi:uncharacterized protein [Miscanthus floridulus]|uniref:uncharacterized protein n=1 Tax=Miscanthus floridulus TaxID=154761 RepID=UPI00345B48E0